MVETLLAQNVERAAQVKLRRLKLSMVRGELYLTITPTGAYIELRTLRSQLKLAQTGHHFGQSSPHRKSLRIPGEQKNTTQIK